MCSYSSSIILETDFLWLEHQAILGSASNQYLFNIAKFLHLLFGRLEFYISDLKSRTDKTKDIIYIRSSRRNSQLEKKDTVILRRHFIFFSFSFFLSVCLLLLLKVQQMIITPKRGSGKEINICLGKRQQSKLPVELGNHEMKYIYPECVFIL